METQINNFSGVRKITPRRLISQEEALTFEGLPNGLELYELKKLLKRYGNEYFTPREKEYLEYMLDHTQPQDWHFGCRPIVWSSMLNIADDLGIGLDCKNEKDRMRQIRALEDSLNKKGALTWQDSSSHKRYGKRNKATGHIEYAFGIDLSPLAFLCGELEDIMVKREALKKERKQLNLRLSGLNRHIKGMLQAMQQYPELLDVLNEAQYHYANAEAWTSLEIEDKGEIDDKLAYKKILAAYLAKLCDELKLVLKRTESNIEETVNNPSPNYPYYGYTSPYDAENPPPYITIQNIMLYTKACNEDNMDKSENNETKEEMSSANASHSIHKVENTFKVTKNTSLSEFSEMLENGLANSQSALDGNGQSELFGSPENSLLSNGNSQNTNKTGIEHINPEQIRSACSPAFLSTMPYPRKDCGWTEIYNSANTIRKYYMISDSAWDDAIKIMGSNAAAVCVMLADARLNDPVNPVRSAGGFLRGCTKQAKLGKLNLHKSLFALLKNTNIGNYDA